MRLSVRHLARLCVVALIGLSGAACQDDLPTATGEDRFPGGKLPVSIEYVIPASELLEDADVYRDYLDSRRLGYRLIAEQHQGVFDAHVLARFEFPDSLTLTVDGQSQVDHDLEFGTAEMFAVVDSLGTTSSSAVRLRMFALTQEWDPETTDWTVASDADQGRVDWLVPGGTPGDLLAQAMWVPGDTAMADTVTFAIDSVAVQKMAAEGFPGVLVTAETAGSRMQLNGFTLRLDVRPSLLPDSVITRTVNAEAQTFVFNPAPPDPAEYWSVGGVTGDRTVLRLRLPTHLPGCDPDEGEACADIGIANITLNEATLLLTPEAPPAGYRPHRQFTLRTRGVIDPSLGRRAPLSTILSSDSIAADAFVPPLPESVPIEFTTAVSNAFTRDSAFVSIALLNEPPGSSFGYAWFRGEPELRLIYTLPIKPTLP